MEQEYRIWTHDQRQAFDPRGLRRYTLTESGNVIVPKEWDDQLKARSVGATAASEAAEVVETFSLIPGPLRTLDRAAREEGADTPMPKEMANSLWTDLRDRAAEAHRTGGLDIGEEA